jgi:hypothetical protein
MIIRDVYTAAHTLLLDSFKTRVIDRKSKTCVFRQTQDVHSSWRRAGDYTVFVAGSFDIFTLNHLRALLQYRVIAGAVKRGIDPETIKSIDDIKVLTDLATDPEIKLMATVDTDKSLSLSKSGKSDKGGASRPVLGWDSRALMLSAQWVPVQTDAPHTQLTDFITIHGEECCLSCGGDTCVNADNGRMALELAPDLAIISRGARRTTTDFIRYKQHELMRDTKVVIFNEEDGHSFIDNLLPDRVISTTSIVKKIKYDG